MSNEHLLPAESKQFLQTLFDLASDQQKIELAWAIAVGDMPCGYQLEGDELRIVYRRD